jgi:ribosomal protein L12E/L44/L45/RPP1/RPP2
MAIAPIDLQAIFSQVDKVGKAQISQREGQALHQAIQGVQIQKKIEENIQQVNEAQNTGEGAEKIKDRGADSKKQGSGGKKRQEEKMNEEEKPFFLSDPSLGKKIDISL